MTLRKKMLAPMSPPRMFNTALDRKGTSFLTPTRATAAAVERYDEFFGLATKEIAGVNNDVSALICSLILFDTPFAVEDIPQMTDAALRADPSDSNICIHWTRNRRIFCRELSRSTLALLKQVGCRENVVIGSAVADAVAIIGRWYPLPDRANRESTLQWIMNDAAAWHYMNLPRPLFADLCHVQPMTPLSREVLARRLREPRTEPEPALNTRHRESVLEDALSEAIGTALFGPNESSSSAWLVTALLEALKSKNNGEIQARIAKDRSREAAIRSLAKLCKRLESADPATALIYDLAMFMLNAGTARTSSGNVETIRAYMDDLAKDLHSAIAKTRRHPLEMTDQDWHGLLISLRDAAPSMTRSKSIAALNKYLQSQLGIEAFLPKNGAAEFRVVHANVVWPNEWKAASDFVRTHEPDNRLQEQLAVMLWIGDHAPIRIGELSLMRLRNIRVINTEETKQIELEIAPRRGLHAGKSEAARRIIPIGKAEDCGVLLDWVDRRKTECADPDDFLFGDPHQLGKLYRLGRCLLSLNRTLKWVTRDSAVSFHTLRHTVITRLVNEAFEVPDARQATARLQEIAVLAGHESVETTLICYFHTAYEPLRAAIDRKIGSLFAGETNGKLSASTLHDLLPKASNKSPQVAPSSSAVCEKPSTAQALRLDLARKALMDICNHLPPEAIASRCGISMSTLAVFVSCALDVTGPLLRSSVAGQFDDDLDPLELRLTKVRQRVEKLGFDFSQPELKIHQTLWSELSKKEPVAIELIARSWLRSFKAGVISLESPTDWHPIVDFMKEAKVPAAHFLVRIASDPGVRGEGTDSVLLAKHCADTSFDSETVTELVASRRSRPSRYLLVCRRPVLWGSAIRPATCRMSEIHSAFATCAVAVFLRRKVSLKL